MQLKPEDVFKKNDVLLKTGYIPFTRETLDKVLNLPSGYKYMCTWGKLLLCEHCHTLYIVMGENNYEKFRDKYNKRKKCKCGNECKDITFT